LEAEVAALKQRDPFSIPIAELDLWGSTFFPLEKAGLETLGDLCARTAEDLERQIGLTENSINELREALADFDLKLKGD
jgi:DNA-directed RNA polymerase alpha subunit